LFNGFLEWNNWGDWRVRDTRCEFTHHHRTETIKRWITRSVALRSASLVSGIKQLVQINFKAHGNMSRGEFKICWCRIKPWHRNNASSGAKSNDSNRLTFLVVLFRLRLRISTGLPPILTRFICGFPQSFETNSDIRPSNTPRQSPTISLRNQHSWLSSRLLYWLTSLVETASLNNLRIKQPDPQLNWSYV
jgi:hypothetical protein